jgi:sugar O-acyltransferase (sialic acid O-acetyltransferase NeuD family)
MRIVLGAGDKVSQACDVYTIWPEISQFYEVPLLEGETKRGLPVIDRILDPTDKPIVHTMIGECRDKRRIVEAFKKEVAVTDDFMYEWGNLYHRTSVFTNPQQIGEDVIIRPLTIISSNVILGDHVDIGNLNNIGHDCIIGNYSVIAGGAALSGRVHLGEGVFIGQGACVKPKVRIGDGAVVGTGAVVVNDVAPNMVVAGNPARTNVKFKKVSHWNQSS